jgi:hypothetical protein
VSAGREGVPERRVLSSPNASQRPSLIAGSAVAPPRTRVAGRDLPQWNYGVVGQGARPSSQGRMLG